MFYIAVRWHGGIKLLRLQNLFLLKYCYYPYIMTQEIERIEHHQSIRRLLKWMKSKGYKSSKLVTPANFPGCGRGMMAKVNISENTCIISIPRSLLITTSDVYSSWLGPIIYQTSIHLFPREVLSVFLVYEKFRGSESVWEPYINTLPINYTMPIYWENALSNSTYSYKDIFINQIDEIKLSYKRAKHFSDLLENERLELRGAMNFENFIWAWCTIQTRGVHFKDKTSLDENDNYALAPYLDFFNHSTSANVTAGFNNKTECYEITTHQRHQKCNQIYINYGTFDNLGLILNYGFYVLPNVNSSVQFKLDEICECLKEMNLDENVNKKLKLLADHNLVRDIACRFEEVSWNFVVCARVLVSSYEELRHWSLAMEGPISTKNEESCSKLIEMCLNNRIKKVSKHFNDVTSNEAGQFYLVLLSEEKSLLESCVKV